MLHKITVDDDVGSERTEWVTGASFQATATYNSSVEIIAGQAMTVKAGYTITTYKNKVLEYHEVIQRDRDGKIFRVTSDGDDRATPEAASFDLRQVDAEEYNPVGYPASNASSAEVSP